MEKKKPVKEEKDESTMKLLGIYRRKCQQNGVPQVKPFKEKLEEVAQEGKFETLQMWDDIGPVCVRAIMDCFSEITYKHLKKIRLWKVRAQDEGVRAICNYIDKAQTVEYLDLLDNQITPLGCEFLGKTLSGACPILKLKLDHNSFGTQGLKNMTVGLRQNNKIQKISLKYCNINEQGSKYLQEILANLNTKLRSLKLQGNPLKNQGAFQLLRAIDFNQSLQKLNIADIQINLLSEQQPTPQQIHLTEKLTEVLQKNKNIFSYDMRFNQMSDEVAHKIVMRVQANTSIIKFEVSQTVAQQIRELLGQALKKRKVHKKGKKKKAASKKKK